MKEKIMKYKKKIIGTVAGVAVLSIAIGGGYLGMGYHYAKQNDRYTEKQIRDIATAQVAGEVISVRKQFELEDDRLPHSEFEYEVEIKTADNMLKTVDVSSRTGTVDVDD